MLRKLAVSRSPIGFRNVDGWNSGPRRPTRPAAAPTPWNLNITLLGKRLGDAHSFLLVVANGDVVVMVSRAKLLWGLPCEAGRVLGWERSSTCDDRTI